MARRTKRTIRREPPITRELLKVANDLHRLNARLIKLAERVSRAEGDSTALQAFMASVQTERDEPAPADPARD